MRKLLCRLGLHWPIDICHYYFTDIVSGLPVYKGRCSCGREFMTNGRWHFFRVETGISKKR
jgi:hypothetical protein